MTAYDIRARASAARALAPISQGGKGQAVTLSRLSSGSYDPATGSASVTTTTQDGSGLELEYSAYDIDGTLIRQGDKKFLLSAFTVTGGVLTAPELDDTLTLANGSVWTVKDIGPLSPAGTDIFYTLQLRGS